MGAVARAYGSPALRLSAALFVLGPACIHLAVVPEHLVEYLPYGLFFLVVGLVQIGLAAALLLRPSPLLLLGGAAGILVVIGVWIWSRTTGILRLPGMPEAIGLPDLLTSLMEFVAVVLLLIADLRLDRTGTPFRPLRAAPGLALAVLVSFAFTFFSLAGVGASGH